MNGTWTYAPPPVSKSYLVVVGPLTMASTSMNVFVGNDSPVGGVGPTQYSVSPTPLVAVCVARLSVLVSVGEAVTVVLEKTAPTGQSWQISTIARL